MKTLLGLVAFCAVVTGYLACGGDDWVKVADCSTGPAWKIDRELICDDHQQATFAARNWRADDNAITACEFCEGVSP